jgi:beta-alanine degradation protein BauB
MKSPARKLSRRHILLLLAAAGGGAAGTSARAQDAAKINPRAYKVLIENDKVRVLEYLSKPGLGVCGVGRHFHPAHVTVSISGGKFKATREDGKAVMGTSPPGRIFWAPAETHEVENVGTGNSHVYIIEMKDKDWKPSTS